MSDDFLIKPEDVDTFAYAVDDHNPWYFEDSPFGGPIVHPTLLGNQALLMRHSKIHRAGGPARQDAVRVHRAAARRHARALARQDDRQVRAARPALHGDAVRDARGGAPARCTPAASSRR